VGLRQRPPAAHNGVDPDVAVRQAWPDRLIEAIATRQRGVVTRSQLVSLGVREGTIDEAQRRGRLRSIHRGVYALGHLALPPFATELATVLAVGEGAYLSHFSAAALWQIVSQAPATVQVTLVGRDAGRRRAGIEVHQTQAIDLQDVTIHQGIAVTRPARVLLDIAPRLSDRRLERMFDRGLKERRFSRHAVATVAARYPRAPAAARVRALAAREGRFSTLTKSPPEDDMLALVRAGGCRNPRSTCGWDHMRWTFCGARSG
jgi:hypothetical protein